jgi:hypothetical protein
MFTSQQFFSLANARHAGERNGKGGKGRGGEGRGGEGRGGEGREHVKEMLQLEAQIENSD